MGIERAFVEFSGRTISEKEAESFGVYYLSLAL